MSVLCQSLQAPHITTPSFTKKEIMKRPRLHRSNQDPVIWSPRYQDRLYRHPTLIQLPHQTLPRTLPRGVHPPPLSKGSSGSRQLDRAHIIPRHVNQVWRCSRSWMALHARPSGPSLRANICSVAHPRNKVCWHKIRPELSCFPCICLSFY